MADNEHFLVTGALGCIGSWTVANLVKDGVQVTTYDLGDDLYRLRYLLDEDELAGIDVVQGDIADLETLERVTGERGITHIVHLAALQIPFCEPNPPLGARVNVLGTVNVFEVAKRQADHVKQVAYASSTAVYGPPDAYPPGPVPPDAALYPSTHYGVYKQANEGTAQLYWEKDGLPSVGLRPYIVYGVGRDQGMTSGTSKAMLAAAAGRRYHVAHGGRSDYNFADDVARAFIQCARVPHEGTSVHNLTGNGHHVSEVVAAIEAAAPEAKGLITFESDVTFPYPERLDESSLAEVIGEIPYTPLDEGVRRSVERFTQLIKAGQIDIDRHLT